MSNNVIDERAKRTVRRKMRKREFDKMYSLAAVRDNGSQRIRLLDEGMVVGYHGGPLFYIKKGTLKKYLRELPDDYVGTINLGHMDFATFPFLLGTWTKKDLILVDIGDGRQALDVYLRLDEGSAFVQELRRADYTLGVSAEFTYEVDYDNTKKYNLEILDEIFITNFAIVGECGNVNSSGIRLSGGTDMNIKELTKAFDGEHTDLGEINKKLEALLENEKQLTTAAEEAKKAEKDAADDAQDAAGEAAAQPAKETPQDAENASDRAKEAVDEPKAEEAKELAGIGTVLEKLSAEVARLSAENAKLTKRLAAKDKAEQAFIEKFKNLSVSLSTESVTEALEAEASGTNDIFTDGIGEF